MHGIEVTIKGIDLAQQLCGFAARAIIPID